MLRRLVARGLLWDVSMSFRYDPSWLQGCTSSIAKETQMVARVLTGDSGFVRWSNTGLIAFSIAERRKAQIL